MNGRTPGGTRSRAEKPTFVTPGGSGIRFRRLIYAAIGISVFLLIYSIGLSDRTIKPPKRLKLPSAYDMRYWIQGQQFPLEEINWPRATGEKYLAWKSWRAGFNNERISLELAFSFALLWNRTLVLPPRYRHYNLDTFSYEDFFDIEDMKKILPVITFEEFQKLENVPDSYAGYDAKVPTLKWPEMSLMESVFVFPTKPSGGEAADRLAKFATRKRNVIRDNHNIDLDAKTIFFPEHQLFCHFYAYIFCTDPRVDKFMRRAVRDYVHIRPDIFDAANLVIDKLPKNFSAIHIRRGDFQYPQQRQLTGAKIFENIKDLLPAGSDLYVATDESDKALFKREFVDVFSQRFKVHMFDEYSKPVKAIAPSNWIGVIEQIICSRAKHFVGTKLSTYSGYVQRLRGYMNDIEDDTIYFTDTPYPDGYRDTRVFPTEWPTWNDHWIYHALWGREFPESWADLD